MTSLRIEVVAAKAALPDSLLSPESITKDDALAESFCRVRQQSLALCAPLTPEDMMVQSCVEASPAKWHLAHTTWFFETFILAEFLPGYRPFHPDFHWLFNSYYNSLSAQPEKKLRASFSRPGLDAILAYRRHVEEGIAELLRSDTVAEGRRRIVLGLHHEQQHQELLCYDIKHAFWSNPLHPPYNTGADMLTSPTVEQPLRFIEYPGGLFDVGYTGDGAEFDRFSFDNEGPRHAEYLQGFQLGARLITCSEYLAFMEDGGYERPDLWLSDGWETVKSQGWQAPLYWHRESMGAEWSVFTMRGNAPASAMADTRRFKYLEGVPIDQLSQAEKHLLYYDDPQISGCVLE